VHLVNVEGKGDELYRAIREGEKKYDRNEGQNSPKETNGLLVDIHEGEDQLSRVGEARKRLLVSVVADRKATMS
jgi:hypothetical protein